MNTTSTAGDGDTEFTFGGDETGPGKRVKKHKSGKKSGTTGKPANAKKPKKATPAGTKPGKSSASQTSKGSASTSGKSPKPAKSKSTSAGKPAKSSKSAGSKKAASPKPAKAPAGPRPPRQPKAGSPAAKVGQVRSSVSGEPNLTRIDQNGARVTPGFQVKVRPGGVLKSKWFGDTTYGSTAKAKAAAIEWRDKTLKAG